METERETSVVEVREVDILKFKMIKYIKSLALRSKLHGFSHLIHNKSNVVRKLWAFFMFCSICACVFMIVRLIADYNKHDSTISIKIIRDVPVDFPAITICNLNPFDRSNAEQYINKVLDGNKLAYVNDELKINKNPKLINKLIKASIYKDKNLTSGDKIKLGYRLESMLLTCYFNDLPCNSSDFVWRYEYDYTNCYTFNSGFDQKGNKVPIKQINEAGLDKGLKLELFVGEDNLNETKFTLNSGVRLAIHNQSIHPIISSEGKDIPTGFQTNIGIKRSFLFKLDEPYSDCIKATRSRTAYNSHYYRAIFDVLNMTTYRQKVCYRICLQEHIRSACGCVDPSLPNIYSEKGRVCSTLISMECTENQRVFYFASSKLSQCKQCPLECDSSSFQLSTSGSRYLISNQMNSPLSSTRTRFISKLNSSNSITKSVLAANIFYSQMEYNIVQEVESTRLVSLFAHIGGTFTLFIGCSFLTFFELFDCFIHFMIAIFELKFKNDYN
jgi:hypothetical protein